MELELLVQHVDPALPLARVRELCEALPREAPRDWRYLAAALALTRAARPGDERGAVLGISGGQGAGKTTLSGLLVKAHEILGGRAVALSLDDFYLPRADRVVLARSVHPLFATRGVPGTHDVPLALTVIEDIRAGHTARYPVFDKAADDRSATERVVEAGVELIVFEGWCLGASAQPDAALETPVNTLERLEDGDGRWRRHVNDCLAGEYQRLWADLDELLYLQVPDLAAVVRWRAEQERQHPQERRMTEDAIRRFVAHYERLTRWMLATLPATADMVGLLDENHGLAAFRRRSS